MKTILTMAAIALVATASPAFAHHIMGGQTPATFLQGLLSGLGHPVIGLDHFATIVAVGCLAAWQRVGTWLVVGFTAAMSFGVAMHVIGLTVPGAEMMVALCVIVLGILMVRREIPTAAYDVVLFVFAGFVNGYALGESIFGAERTPYYAYLFGLAVIQCAIGLAAITIARRVVTSDVTPLRLVGAGIAGIGLAVAVAQIVPAA